MKTKNLHLILLIAFSFLTSCNSANQNKSKALNNSQNLSVNILIEQNKDKQLFLGFWEGMSEKEFQKVKEHENKTGNLSNNCFIVKFSKYSNDKIIQFPLKLNYSGDVIQLSTNDRHKEKISNYLNKEYLPEYRNKHIKYEYLIEYLIDTYDQKYERIHLEDRSNNEKNLIYWITGRDNDSKLITLDAYLYCMYFDVIFRSPTITDLKGIEKTGESVKNYQWSDLLSEFNKKSTVLDFNIIITYEIYGSYKQKLIERKKKQKIKRKLQLEKNVIIKENKQHL